MPAASVKPRMSGPRLVSFMETLQPGLCKTNSCFRRRLSDLSAPGHQAIEESDAGEVVVEHRHHQQEKDGQTGEQHLLLHPHAEIATRDPLERHDHDVSPVKDG